MYVCVYVRLQLETVNIHRIGYFPKQANKVGAQPWGG
jgi:hypothetical protein